MFSWLSSKAVGILPSRVPKFHTCWTELCVVVVVVFEEHIIL